MLAQVGEDLLGAGVAKASGLGLVGGDSCDRVARGAFVQTQDVLGQRVAGLIDLGPEVGDEVRPEHSGVGRAGLAVERGADRVLARVVDASTRHFSSGCWTQLWCTGLYLLADTRGFVLHLDLCGGTRCGCAHPYDD